MTTEEADQEIDFSKLMRADQALDWLTPILGGRTIAKAEIADLMRDGLIQAYARRAWDSETRNPAMAWKKEPDEDDDSTGLEVDISVNTWVWRRSRQWRVDQMDWRWPSGRFSVIHSLKPFRRILIEHVHFDPDEIRKLGEQHSGQQDGAPRPLPLAGDGELPQPLKLDDEMFEGKGKEGKRRGRHVHGKAWATVCSELWRLREQGELSNGRFNGLESLAYYCAELTIQCGSEVLKQGTIEPLITALIKSGFMPKQGIN